MAKEASGPESEYGEKSNLKTCKAETSARLKADRAERSMQIKAQKAQKAAQLKADRTAFEGVENRIRENIQARLEALMGGESVYGEPKSIQDISDGTGISRAAIRKYTLCAKGGSESAVPSAVALGKIADYFAVTPNYLLGYTEDDSTERPLLELKDAVKVTGLKSETVKLLAKVRAAGAGEGRPHAIRALDAAVAAAAREILQDSGD